LHMVGFRERFPIILQACAGMRTAKSGTVLRENFPENF
jgi:hypothetical protein